MRKLMWFTIGFTTACAAGIYLLLGNLLLIAGAVCALSAIAVAFICKNWSNRLAVALLGVTIGSLWLTGFDSLYLNDARILDGEKGNYQIRISDYSYPTDRGCAVDGEVLIDGKSYDVRVYFDTEMDLRPGDCVDGEFTMRFTGFGGKKVPTDHQGKGIFLLAYAQDFSVSWGTRETFLDFPVKLRQDISTMLEQVFPEDTSAFAKALLLGDTSDLDYETNTDFSVSGIRHVVAVSGLHISILFALVYLLTMKKKWLTAIIGIPLLLLFAAVAGFSPSVVRACVMQMLIILALLVNKEYDAPTALAFSVLVLLALNPVTVTSISFQLSVGCMIGIFSFSSRINSYLMNEKRLGRWKIRSWRWRIARWASGSVSVTIGAMIATSPLCAVHFGLISIVGILTNLLVLWMISLVFYGIMLACTLGFLWLPVGACVAWVIAWMIRLVKVIASIFASFPLAAVYTCSVYIVLWLCFCYLMLALFFLLKRKHPWLMSSCVAIGLIFAVCASWIEPRMDDFRLSVLDVGQGQCILLEQDGNRYLVDCGGDAAVQAADTAAEYLLSQGIFSLDGVILTHYDTDHAAGMPLLLSRIPADSLYLPDFDEENPIRLELMAAYAGQINWIGSQQQYAIEETNITLLSTENSSSGNECGVCILFQPENCDILITGDRGKSGERALVAEYDLPLLEVLLVGHHGSKNSTTLELLQETKPLTAIISVGTNSYGHPTEDVLDRLELYNCQILRTDQDGTIIIRR